MPRILWIVAPTLVAFLPSACRSLPPETSVATRSGTQYVLESRPWAGPVSQAGDYPKYLDLLYEPAVDSIRFEFGTGPSSVFIRKRLSTDGAEQLEAPAGGRYELELKFVPGSPDKTILVLSSGETEIGRMDNHNCYGPGLAVEPMTEPRLFTLPDSGGYGSIAVETEGLGFPSGFTMRGMNLLAEPEWVKESQHALENQTLEEQAADAWDWTKLSDTAGCIVDPKPKPKPYPLAARAGASEYVSLEYMLVKLEGDSKASYAIKLWLVGPAGLEFYLAPPGSPDSNRVVIARSGDVLTLRYVWRALGRSLVQLEVERAQGNLPAGNASMIATLVGKLRPTGQFRAPTLRSLGTREAALGQDGAKIKVNVIDVALEAFGQPIGFTLFAQNLRLKD